MITAYDDKVLVGFLQYQVSKMSAAIGCCVAQTGCQEGQGSAAREQMMAPVLERYPACFLPCSMLQVPNYLDLGFTVCGSEGGMVVMATKAASKLQARVVNRLEHKVLLAEPEYKRAYETLRSKHGALGAAKILDALNERALVEKSRIEVFVKNLQGQAHGARKCTI